MTQGARALVVDDDDAIRFMVGTILEREGYDVDQAKDGFEAIQKLQRHDYRLVLLDLMMPKVDGFHVLRQLRSEKPQLLSRVVVMTALSAESIGFRIERVLYKPFDISALTDHARQLLRAADEDEQIA